MAKRKIEIYNRKRDTSVQGGSVLLEVLGER